MLLKIKLKEKLMFFYSIYWTFPKSAAINVFKATLTTLSLVVKIVTSINSSVRQLLNKYNDKIGAFFWLG